MIPGARLMVQITTERVSTASSARHQKAEKTR